MASVLSGSWIQMFIRGKHLPTWKVWYTQVERMLYFQHEASNRFAVVIYLPKLCRLFAGRYMQAALSGSCVSPLRWEDWRSRYIATPGRYG